MWDFAGRARFAGEMRWSVMLDFALLALLGVLLTVVMVYAMFYALRRWL